jgi:hypothetical protein
MASESQSGTASENSEAQQNSLVGEDWSLGTLVSVYTSHRTAFYALWNYLWLVIVASLVASYSLDKQKIGWSGPFRLFLLVAFVGYAVVNCRLLLDMQREIQAVVEAIRRRALKNLVTPTLASYNSRRSVFWTQVALTAVAAAGHLILIIGNACADWGGDGCPRCSAVRASLIGDSIRSETRAIGGGSLPHPSRVDRGFFRSLGLCADLIGVVRRAGDRWWI